MRNYRALAEGEKTAIDWQRQQLRLACECGAVRNIKCAVDGSRMEFAITNDPRATAAKRREQRKDDEMREFGARVAVHIETVQRIAPMLRRLTEILDQFTREPEPQFLRRVTTENALKL